MRRGEAWGSGGGGERRITKRDVEEGEGREKAGNGREKGGGGEGGQRERGKERWRGREREGNENGALSVLVQRNSREINGSSSCPSECSIHRSRSRSTGGVNTTNPTPALVTSVCPLPSGGRRG